MKEMVVEASMAVAIGAKLCRPKVIPMYPITPQTHIVERLAEFINNGELKAKMIHVESEHSACSALFGAAATGVRAFTATASQGLALMYEILPIVAGNRIPTVMVVGNRALSAPINIWNDHSDAVSARDQGWVQLWVSSSQEALDTVIQAYRIAENRSVLLPVMVCMDGFTLTHVFERVKVPSQKEVDGYLPKFKPVTYLDPKRPMTIGPIAFPDSFMELKEEQHKAALAASRVIREENRQFKRHFGRSYGNGLVETHYLEDAEYAILGMGTLCDTAKVAARALRSEGVKTGVIRLRALRPFPVKELLNACSGLKGIAVIDRHISVGYEGPLYTELKATLAGERLHIAGFIAGLGGRDITVNHLKKAVKSTAKGGRGSWLK
jgi:pyruvate ferredoxin oxidoreductase alpha subunit